MSRDVEALIDRAHTQARHQNLHGTIETLRRALTLDATTRMRTRCFRSVCTIKSACTRRDYEARAALTPESGVAVSHYHAMATVSTAHRRFKVAEQHLNSGARPGSWQSQPPRTYRQLCQVYGTARNKVLPLLEKAREI